MKPFKQHILEKLRISNKQPITHTLFPKNRYELIKMIKDEMHKNGNKCSLNHIDVSEITDMNNVFYYSQFNGDISEWNVSNVTDMGSMFYQAQFTGENGDISNWDVSKVKDFSFMFTNSAFKQDLTPWKNKIKDKHQLQYIQYYIE